MSKLEEYQTKKTSLETDLEETKREIIITEQGITQQKALFVQQFQTDDVEQLKVIAQQYEASILAKEQELQLLEQNG